MPQLTVETTTNVQQHVDWPSVLDQLHHMLADTLDIPLDACKSRVCPRDTYAVGDGDFHRAFVHLELAILTGRDDMLKKRVGEEALRILSEHLKPSFEQLDLQVTVEVREMEKELYFKRQSGS